MGLGVGETCDPVTCQPVPSVSNTFCSTATVSAATVSAGSSSLLTCSAAAPNAATVYTLECGNGQSYTGTGNTLACTYATAGTFAPRCRVDNETVFSPACTRSVTVTPPGGGGSSSFCSYITLSASTTSSPTLTSQITCQATNSAAAIEYAIDCGNGQSFTGATNTATCNYVAGTFAPRCRVNNEPSPPVAACIGSVRV